MVSRTYELCFELYGAKQIFSMFMPIGTTFKKLKPVIVMFKKFTIADMLLFVAAFLSLIFSEILYFNGEENAAIFIGLWVPSILAFGIYLKILNSQKND